MTLDDVRIATGRRVICIWSNKNHAYAETVIHGAPRTQAIYLDRKWLEILESNDGGKTWEIAPPEAHPILHV